MSARVGIAMLLWGVILLVLSLVPQSVRHQADEAGFIVGFLLALGGCILIGGSE